MRRSFWFLLLIPVLAAACDGSFTFTTEPIIQCIAGDSVVITDTLITGCIDPRDLPFDTVSVDPDSANG